MKYVLAALLLLACASRVVSVTWRPVASGDINVLSNAIASASQGDVLYVYDDSVIHIWSNSLSYTKALHLISEGAKISDGRVASINGILFLDLLTNARSPCRISGFIFADGGHTGGGADNGEIVPDLGSNANNDTNVWMRIDHNTFNLLNGNNLLLHNWFGVVDNNTFYAHAQEQMIYGRHNWWNGGTVQNCCGHGSWAEDVNWNSDRFIFIETNNFIGLATKNWFPTDGSSGMRMVFRNNNVSGGHPTVELGHGTDSGGPRRGTRAYAMYHNNIMSDGSAGEGIAANVRGGEMVLYENIITNFSPSGVHFSVDYHRFHTRFGFYYGADGGTNYFDRRDTNGTIDIGVGINAFATGVVTSVGSLTLTDSSAAWTAGQWTNYTVWNLNRPVNTRNFGYIIANTTNSLTWKSDSFATSPDVGTQFTNGNSYAIFKVLAGLDMPGMGRSTAWTNGSPGGNSPIAPAGWSTNNDQTNPGIWEWDNNNTGAPGGANPSHYFVASDVYAVQLWTNVHNATVKSNYTQFTYPHPIRVMCDSYAISPTTQTVQTNVPIAFNATGGSGTNLTFHLWVNNSGGTINTNTGAYMAGPLGSVVDTVRAWDTYGNYRDALVSVVTTNITQASTPGMHRPRRR